MTTPNAATLTDAECDAIRARVELHGDEQLSNVMVRVVREAKRAGFAAGAASVRAVPVSLTLTPEEISGLVEFSGADEADSSELTVEYFYEHEDGPGWYAYISEYPEEGSIPVHLPYDDHNAEDAALSAAPTKGKP